MKYFVQYEVEGFPGTQQAGPYSKEDVQYQRNDIAGYEGVKNVKVIEALEE
jgi:hypothetical protein